MSRHTGISMFPGPPGPPSGQSAGTPRQDTPTLAAFVRGRVVSGNGLAAALYLALSVWILLNPRQAAAIWQRLQGHPTQDE